MDHQDLLLNILPENADKLLFAEDLVSYIMNDVLFFAPYEGTRATPYRGLIHCAFNDFIKTAVNEIANHRLRCNYVFYDQVGSMAEPDESQYLELIKHFKLTFLSQGFDPKVFLDYSINVSITGAMFWRNGLGGALDMAVTAISDYIKDYDMMSTGWNTLTVFASVAHKLHTDSAKILTPDSLSLHSSSPESENYQLDFFDMSDQEEEIESSHAAEVNPTDSKCNRVNENGATIRDLESPCVSTEKEIVLPRKSFGNAVKDTTGKTASIPIVNSFAAVELEYGKILSPDSEEDRVLNTIQNNNIRTPTTSKADTSMQVNPIDSKYNQVNENGATRDLESPCMSTKKEIVQPRKGFGNAVKDTTGKTDLIPIDNLFAAVEIEYDKLMSPDSAEDRVLNTIQNKNIRSPTTSKADTKVCSAQRKDTLLIEDIIDVYTSDEYEELAKEECAIAKPEGKSKTNIHSLASSSKSSLPKDESDYHVDSQSKSFEITSSTNSVREKRLSDLDLRQINDKKLKNSKLHKQD